MKTMKIRIDTNSVLKDGILRVNKKAVIFLLLMFCTIQLAYLDNIGLSTFYSVGYLLALVYILISIKEVKFSPVLVFIFLYNVFVCLSTIMNSGFSVSAILYLVTSSIYPLLLDTMLKKM